VGAVYSC